MAVHRYMAQGHDVTMMAVLLGMAAARRGSMHNAIAKMLCLHIPSLHPPTFTELELEVRPHAHTPATHARAPLPQARVACPRYCMGGHVPHTSTPHAEAPHA